MRLHLPKTPQLQNHSSQLRIFISLWGHKPHSNHSTALEGFKESWCEHRSDLLGAGVHDAHRCLNLRIITNLIASGLQVSNFSFSSFTNGSSSLFWNSVCLLLLSIAWVNLFPKLSLFILLHIGEMYPLPWSHYQNLVRPAPFLTYITVSWCFIAAVISISLAVSYHWTPIAMGTLLQSNLAMLYRVWRSSFFLWHCKSSFYLSMQHLSSSGSRFYVEYSPLSLQGLWLLAFEGLWSLPFLLSPVPVFPLCPWLVKCSYQVFTNLKSKSNRIRSIKTSLSVSRSYRVALLTHPLFQQPVPVFILLFTKFFG